jgi:hypothetical protein
MHILMRSVFCGLNNARKTSAFFLIIKFDMRIMRYWADINPKYVIHQTTGFLKIYSVVSVIYE